MSPQVFDVIVVGAGAVGSAAAYHAARSGINVLLLEQFEIDHQRGSSYGYSRIIRYAYDKPIYTELAKAAYPAWAALEAEAGEQLYFRTGGLDFGPAQEPSLLAVAAALDASGVAYERLDAVEAQTRFPQFRFSSDMTVLYQPDAGILAASRCVLAQVRLAEKSGAVVRDHTAVTEIEAHADSVTVRTTEGRFSAGKLILAPGAWGAQVFGMVGLHAPLTPVRTQENYFATEPEAGYSVGQFPVFLAHLRKAYDFMPYGLPSHDGSGLKVGLHGGPAIPDLTALSYEPDEEIIAAVRTFMGQYLPPGDWPLRQARVCLYTMTPDEDFVIDRHPQNPQIVISASCSGHAFKFSTLLGQILADLSLKGETAYDLKPFRLARFDNLQTVTRD